MLIIKGTKYGHILAVVSLFVFAISFLWPEASQSNQAFLGAIAGVVGGLAKGAVSLFSGKGKAARKEAKQAKKDAKAAQKAAEIQAKTAQIEAETAAKKGAAAGNNIMALVKQYWWIGAIVLGAIFVLPMLKKKVGNRNGRSRTSRTGSKGLAWSRKMLAAKRRKRTTKRKRK